MPSVSAQRSPQGHPHRGGARRAVERGRHPGAPVDDERITVLIVDVPAPDMPTLAAVHVEPAKEERAAGVVAQGLSPVIEGAREVRGREGVPRCDLDRLGAFAHARQGGAGCGEVGPFSGEFGVGHNE